MVNRVSLITGASGALGSVICNQLVRTNEVKIVTVRRDSSNSYLNNFKEQVDANRDSELVLVHCGWDTTDRTALAQSRSKEETIKLSDHCAERGIKMIFISSHSASENAQSNYGEAKFIAENYVLSTGGICIKPGLILFEPPAGLQRKLLVFSRFGIGLNFFPKSKITVTEIQNVLYEINKLICGETWNSSTISLTDRQVDLNVLCSAIRAKHFLTIPVPLRLLRRITRIIGIMSRKSIGVHDSLSAIID